MLNFIKEISLDLFMTFGPAGNYVFQAMKFHKTKSSKGFSNLICLVTILSHTLKIFFWFGKKFKYTLLVQSILVIIMQLYILYLCTKFKEVDPNKNRTKSVLLEKKTKRFVWELFDFSETFKLKLIWRWDKVMNYYKFYFLIISALTIFSFLFGIRNKHYINIIGSFSVILETLCSLPQIVEMYRTKNQRNISKIMVFMWFAGNVLKTYYNIYNNSPLQLIIGSYIQVFSNVILVSQMIYYYNMNKKESQVINNNIELDLNDDSFDKEKENAHLMVDSRSDTKQ